VNFLFIVIRQVPSGLQTLGKVVAARRMPPPSNLPSLARTHGQSIIQTNENNNSSSKTSSVDQSYTNTSANSANYHQTSSQQQTSVTSTQSGSEQVPVTIAAVVSGATNMGTSIPAGLNQPMNAANQQSWPTPLAASQNTEVTSQLSSTQSGDDLHQNSYKNCINTTKWGQNEFPNLADAALLTQQQTQPKPQTQSASEQLHMNQPNLPSNSSNAQFNNGPVLKPTSNLFN